MTDYGAKGDGKALETAAIQRAVEACAARAAGRHVSLCAQQSHVYWQSHCANPLMDRLRRQISLLALICRGFSFPACRH